jgi:hypothetical protein
MARVTFHHLVARLEASIGYLCHSQLLMVGLLSGDDRRVGGKREVDTWVWNQIGLELCKIDIESSIEAQRCSDRADYLLMQKFIYKFKYLQDAYNY